GGVEDSVNGCLQLARHATGYGLPEMHLVDAEKAQRSYGGMIGSFVGKALDIAGLTIVTGGLGGGASATAAALKLGLGGAVYGGVFSRSREDSSQFFADRAANAAVNFATFFTMAETAALLNATGAFANPAVRSLSGHLFYGGTSGLAGGI